MKCALIALAIIYFFGITLSASAADQCDPLRPNPPRNISQEVTGKLDAKIEGMAKRLLSAGGNIDGTYKEASADVLKEYPNADKLYMWERTLYMYCITIMNSTLPDLDKANRIEKLFDRIGQPPPDRSGSDVKQNKFTGSYYHDMPLLIGENAEFIGKDKSLTFRTLDNGSIQAEKNVSEEISYNNKTWKLQLNIAYLFRGSQVTNGTIFTSQNTNDDCGQALVPMMVLDISLRNWGKPLKVDEELVHDSRRPWLVKQKWYHFRRNRDERNVLFVYWTKPTQPGNRYNCIVENRYERYFSLLQ